MGEHGIRLSPGLLTFVIGLLLLAFAGVLYQQHLISSGQLNTAVRSSAPAANIKYACPMRCVDADEPGRCPVCGMDMLPIVMDSGVGQADISSGGGGQAASTPSSYTCPMHPQIEQDRPGTCPICLMELVPKRDSAIAVDPAMAEAVGTVKLGPAQELLAAVEPVHPSRENIELSLPAIGEVMPAQDKMQMLTSWQEGRVDHLLLRETGGQIKAGEHLMDIYSPDLVQAQEEYLLALRAAEQLGEVEYESAAQGSQRMRSAARQKLVRLGLTEEQITTLEETRKPSEHVAIYAKFGGTVMEKKVQEGMYVMPGEELYSLVDLSEVWVEVQVFEQDAANLKPGMQVTLTSPAYPQRTFIGRVQLIEPELGMDTRTFRARVVVRNPGNLLKPGQVLNASIRVDHGDLLLLPRNAVLHTGEGDLVYVMVGEGRWQPRRVVVGRDFGEKVEILEGLKPDEAVAGTAVFLLDSEAQLKGVPRPGD